MKSETAFLKSETAFLKIDTSYFEKWDGFCLWKNLPLKYFILLLMRGGLRVEIGFRDSTLIDFDYNGLIVRKELTKNWKCKWKNVNLITYFSFSVEIIIFHINILNVTQDGGVGFGPYSLQNLLVGQPTDLRLPILFPLTISVACIGIKRNSALF